MLGPDHRDTLYASRNNLALAYRAAGRAAEAIPLHERTLADRERILGPDHPDTLTSRNNLAARLPGRGPGRRGDPAARADPGRPRADPGPGPPRAPCNSRNNLADAYRAAGRAAEAIPLLERTLADRERVLGPDHPDTLTSRNNLAYAYVAAGRAAEAIPLYERTLADQERVLGPDHPGTLASRDNLAAARAALG